MARAKNAPESNNEKSPSFSEVFKALFCIEEPFKKLKLWAKIPPRMRYRLWNPKAILENYTRLYRDPIKQISIQFYYGHRLIMRRRHMGI